MNEQQQNPYIIPLSILVSGVLVAGAIMYAGDGSLGRGAAQVGAVTGGGNPPPPPAEEGNRLGAVRPVGAEDHMLGSPSAPVVIVEYSDLECPFCSRFHTTMQQAMDEFGKDGRIAWVYRHFPLESIHPSARPAAVAAECADELGGAEAFWGFVDTVFSKQQEGLDSALFSQVAAGLGLDGGAFSSCLTSDAHNAVIDADVENAIASGGQGTPYSIIIASNGTKTPVNGAVPYATLKMQIEQALGSK